MAFNSNDFNNLLSQLPCVLVTGDLNYTAPSGLAQNWIAD